MHILLFNTAKHAYIRICKYREHTGNYSPDFLYILFITDKR